MRMLRSELLNKLLNKKSRWNFSIITGIVVSASVLALELVPQPLLAASSPPVSSDSAKQGLVNPDSAAEKSLEKKTVIGQIRDRVASLDLKIAAPLAELKLANGANILLNYDWEYLPGYNNYFLRMDRHRLKFDLNAGDMIQDSLNQNSNFRLGLSLVNDTEVLFIRPFKSRGEALKAVPYWLNHIPFTIDEISKKLQVGEFVSFTARMNLLVGLSTLSLSTQKLPLDLWTHYLISGEFQIHLFRKDENHATLKLIAVKKKEQGFGFTAGLSSGHKIFGVRLIDRRLERIMNITQFVKLQETNTKANLIMIDYTIDTRDKRVGDAYNGLVSSLYEFKTLGIANPFSDNQELTDRLLSDMTPFETIYSTERLRAANLRVLDRSFKGKNDVDYRPRSQFALGAVFFRLSKEYDYSENKLTSVDSHEATNYFRLHTFERNLTANFFFSYVKIQNTARASLLFESDKEGHVGDLKGISFEWDYRDKSIKPENLKMIKDAVQQSVPNAVYGKINWGDWDGSKNYHNARMNYQMTIDPSALNKIINIPEGNLFQLVAKYIETIPEPSSESIDPNKNDSDYMMGKTTVVERYQYDILNIAYRLSQALDASRSNEERSRDFGELRFNNLFVEIGPGFLISLLPVADLQNLLYFKVALTGGGVKPLNFEYGTPPDRKFFQAASYIRSVLDAKPDDFFLQQLQSK